MQRGHFGDENVILLEAIHRLHCYCQLWATVHRIVNLDCVEQPKIDQVAVDDEIKDAMKDVVWTVFSGSAEMPQAAS
ncbi:hypothetical protein FHX09_001535 [Rhizobium sp. BK538]|nr:hypothetical protein [Rhizobium sp. BK060]MBB4167704.1 hypothetical protein [Rhizobium sp. BK538]